MNRYVCVYGHFYQPPRENPWLGTVETEPSARPYHDWNERITAECYRPNAAARILDDDDWIVRIVNNYERIGFDFGPTLLSWLERRAGDVHDAVVAADNSASARLDGHGPALAQAYNHMILPLASERDRRTQVRWGLVDFERRFGRPAEGMWLPETAVCTATLESLAAAGVGFTILAPGQARRCRRLGHDDWQDVSGGRIDPRRPYLVRLPSGREIAVFFYDGAISSAIAFEGLLRDGAAFADRLRAGADADAEDGDQLVLVATDGESYGHHHRFGDMALAYALDRLDAEPDIELTNPARYLAGHAPTHEVEVVEPSAWSCAHGVDRWRADCGCASGQNPAWSQAWRGPLRAAFDWLRDRLGEVFEERGGELLEDPWAARDDYVELLHDRSAEAATAFLVRHQSRPLDEDQRCAVLTLLESQRHAMLMYTSCGWFFDDLAGTEAVLLLRHADRALQLAEAASRSSLQAPFLDRLAEAQSNRRRYPDGRAVYRQLVRPARVELADVVAHHAVSGLFAEPEKAPHHGVAVRYAIETEDQRRTEAGKLSLVIGRVRVADRNTEQRDVLTYGLLHFGDHNLHAGVRRFRNAAAYDAMLRDVEEAFRAADQPATLRAIDRHFGASTYSLGSLLGDEQRRIIEAVLATTLARAEIAYQQVYDDTASLTRFLGHHDIPLPAPLRAAADLVLEGRLSAALAQPELSETAVAEAVAEAEAHGIELDPVGLGWVLRSNLEARMDELVALDAGAPADAAALLGRLEAGVRLAAELDLELDLARLQERFFHLQIDGARWRSGEPGSATDEITRLARALRVRLAVTDAAR